MKLAWFVAAIAACSPASTPPPPPPPPASPLANATPPHAPCDLSGSYRLRFRSNNDDGWWLRFTIANGKAELTAYAIEVFALGPLGFTPYAPGCGGTITSHTEQSGDTQLAFTLDPVTGVVAGAVTREKFGEGKPSDTVPATGRRDVGPIAKPACLEPGIYDLAVPTAAWKLTQGQPGIAPATDASCKTFSSGAHATVRVDLLGDQLFVDEVDAENHKQGFARGTVTRTGDCTAKVALEIQDFSFDGTLTFAGSAATGVAATTRFQVFEDGTRGENLWACTAANAPITGTRVAD